MSLVQTTPVPNRLFDLHLATLKEVELKVLLVIIRKTVGWREEKNHRQRRQIQRIPIVSFEMNTGCSRRAISNALQTLIEKGLIHVFDHNGNKLSQANDRKGKYHLYFKAVLEGDILGTSGKNMPMARANSSGKAEQNLLNTIKEKDIKKGIQTFPFQGGSNPLHISSHIFNNPAYGLR